ncbi:MAG: SRPBCC family protein [Fimbriimonadaceae bacterium]
MPAKLTVEAVIERPVQEVFAAFTDFDDFSRILHSAHKVVFLTDHKKGMGAKWQQESGELENPTKAIHEITSFNEPRSFTLVSHDVMADETMHFLFTPADGGTHVQFDMQPEFRKVWAFFAWLFLKGIIRTRMEEDLLRMKSHVEKQA